MAGLFDLLMSGGYDDSEAGRNAQMALAAGLMGGKGSFGSILGNSMMGAQDTYRSSKKDQLSAEVSKAQIDELKRQVEAAKRKQAIEDNLTQIQSQFYKQATPGSGGVDATGGPETAVTPPSPGGMDLQGLMSKLYSTPGGFDKAVQLQGMLRKDAPTIHSLGAGGGAYIGNDGAVHRIPGEPKEADPNKGLPPGMRMNVKTGLPEWIPGYVQAQKDIRAAGRSPSQDAGLDIDEAAVDAAAARYNIDGTLPPMGMGKHGTNGRSKILNRAAELQKAAGVAPDEQRWAQLDAKARAAALTQVTKDLAAIRPYKEMLDKNADIAIDLAGKILKTNVALVNKPITWIAQNMTSSPDVAEFVAQNHFVTTEAARVLSNPRLVGQLTDTAIREMKAVIDGNAPLGSYVRVLQRIKADGTNRTEAMEKERRGLLNAAKEDPAGAPAPAKGGLPSMAEIEAELAKRPR